MLIRTKIGHQKSELPAEFLPLEEALRKVRHAFSDMATAAKRLEELQAHNHKDTWEELLKEEISLSTHTVSMSLEDFSSTKPNANKPFVYYNQRRKQLYFFDKMYPNTTRTWVFIAEIKKGEVHLNLLNSQNMILKDIKALKDKLDAAGEVYAKALKTAYELTATARAEVSHA